MLPFLKNKEAMVSDNAEDEVLRRKSDDGEPFELLDAIAEDMLGAMEKKDRKLLRSALEALCEYVREEDIEQDESLTNKDQES